MARQILQASLQNGAVIVNLVFNDANGQILEIEYKNSTNNTAEVRIKNAEFNNVAFAMEKNSLNVRTIAIRNGKYSLIPDLEEGQWSLPEGFEFGASTVL